MIKALLYLIIAVNLYAVNAIDITQLGTSADQIGRANIQGFGTGAATLFENPARLYTVDSLAVSLFSSQVLDSVDYLAIAAAYRFEDSVLALGRVGAGITDIPNTQGIFSAAGELIGIETLSLFEYGNYIYKAGYQYSPDPTWSLGATLNYYHIKAGESLNGHGVNVDVGLHRILSQYSVEIAAIINNVIPEQKITYATNGASEQLPRRYSLGVKYDVTKAYSIFSEIKKYGFHTDYFLSNALEYKPFYKNRDLNGFVTRVGYRQFPITPVSKRSTLTVGLGMALSVIQLDYSYQVSDHEDYRLQHYFSIGLNF